MTRLLLLARIAFGLVFIAASVHKIIDPHAFAGDIYNYRLFPDELINVLALYLPWVELTGGICLVFGWWRLGAAGLLCGLMAAFMVALGINWARGLDVNCGCFVSGGQGKGDPALALLRDTGFLVLGLLALAGELRGPASERLEPPAA